ncbi:MULTISPECIES: hypothetical protein [unclassified Streptomyces]|uniref:hypothetical protein n=1 Tax=unclassified Streptomyces TaxID=2593676 RepID=UPI00332950B2
MDLTWENAIEEWEEAAEQLQDWAIAALCRALPGLDRSPTPPYCCPVTLSIDKPGSLGAGRVCIDTDHRATVEIGGLDNTVIGQAADSVWGECWFEEAELPLSEADPGGYHYDDETTGAEWVLELGEGGTGKVLIECVTIPEAAAFLAAIAAAHAELTSSGHDPG